MGLFGFFKRTKQIQAPDSRQKRTIPRWVICAPAKVKWEGRGDYLDCQVKDLNMKGLAMVLAEKIPADSLTLSLKFNEECFFDVDVTVAWKKEAGGNNTYGMKFSKMRDADKEKIYRMIRRDFPGLIEMRL